jgi:hypothetical protein
MEVLWTGGATPLPITRRTHTGHAPKHTSRFFADSDLFCNRNASCDKIKPTVQIAKSLCVGETPHFLAFACPPHINSLFGQLEALDGSHVQARVTSWGWYNNMCAQHVVLNGRTGENRALGTGAKKKITSCQNCPSASSKQSSRVWVAKHPYRCEAR